MSIPLPSLIRMVTALVIVFGLLGVGLTHVTHRPAPMAPELEAFIAMGGTLDALCGSDGTRIDP